MFKIRAKVKKWLNIQNIDEVLDQTVFANIAKIESMLNHIQNNLIILCKENISRAELLNMIRDSVVQRNEFSVLEMRYIVDVLKDLHKANISSMESMER